MSEHITKIAGADSLAKVLTEATASVDSGEFAGVIVIGFRPDWSFRFSAAGSVMRVPAMGMAAAQILGSDMEARLRNVAALHATRQDSAPEVPAKWKGEDVVVKMPHKRRGKTDAALSG